MFPKQSEGFDVRLLVNYLLPACAMPQPFQFKARRRILAAVLFVALSVLSARSASALPMLLSTAPGEVFAGLVIEDATGTALFPYVHLATGLTLATVEVSDTTGPVGTLAVANAEDLVPGSFPASYLFGTPPDFSQLSVLFFDFANSSFAGLLWTVPGWAVPINPGTDPTLAALEGGFTSTFLFHSFVPLGNGETVALFDLQAAAPTPVPEPATLSLLAVGAAGLLVRIRRRRVLSAKE